MSHTYSCVAATTRGGPDVLEVVDRPLRAPARGEVRVRVLAAPVCRPDVQARYGQSPLPPRVPFVPGYAVVGVVDVPGDGVGRVAVGDRVAALTTYGGYGEYAYVNERFLIDVPASVDPVEAAPVVLNYLVAYQTLHRSAKVQPGQRVLVIGASGGVGTALLDLGRLAGLTMYGVASGGKQAVVEAFGAAPIDYRTEDFVEVLAHLEPDGVDAVFDGMGGSYVRRSLSTLKRGGTLVSFGNPLTVAGLVRLLAVGVATNLMPNGRTMKGYGTGMARFALRPFIEDWATLFQLLAEGKIHPAVMQRFPILQAAAANALLEAGGVAGNVVLVASQP